MRRSYASTRAELPDCYQSQRKELLRLLLRDAILHRSPVQPVLARDGTSARWMLDSLAVTLEGRGAQLAADCLLALLKRFDGGQIATFGITAIPLLQSVIVRSQGRYSGLLVRKEVKPHGSMRRIEGQLRLDEPVILIDDSISSGVSLQAACEYLEQAGLQVEGAVVLVRFGWDNGYSRMQERGYHMEAVFDVWEDLMPGIAGEPELIRNPTKQFGVLPWSHDAADDGLCPTELARLVLRELLDTGGLLRPPNSLDRDYDSAGGAWVSLREREQIHRRYAREGFWQFPFEQRWSAAESIVRACWLVFEELRDQNTFSDALKRSAIAVTLFSELEATDLSGLNNDLYGIVVCSQERTEVMGGALPRMPGIGREWEQYCHAAFKNAKLRDHEPRQIYRHRVLKLVEPGVEWQKSGIAAISERSAFHDPEICGRLAERARNTAVSELSGAEPAPQMDSMPALPDSFHSLYVTIFYAGKMRGCVGSRIVCWERDLRSLIAATLRDERFEPIGVCPDLSELAVSVSFLFDELVLGEMTAEEVSTRYRLCDQALAAQGAGKFGLLLPFVAVMHNLKRLEFAEQVLEKAEISREPFAWMRYECATWLADKHGCDMLHCGFRDAMPEVSFEQDVQELADLHCGYLMRNQRDDGGFYFVYVPFQNYRYQGGGLPRSAHAAWTLARATHLLKASGLNAAADRALGFHLALARETEGALWIYDEDGKASVSELAFVLLALLELPSDDKRHHHAESIAHTLWGQIDAHGRMATHRKPDNQADAYQDYFPGQAMLALAAAAISGVAAYREDVGLRVMRFYGHRFRHKRDFGQVSWWMQAARRWWEVTRDAGWLEFCFEIGDWILEFQLEKNGGFITSQQTDGPGYTTALYLEGLSAGAALARQAGDSSRRARYLESCQSGFSFLRTLAFWPQHGTILPNGDFAIGGLRADRFSSEIRTDFVQHSLSAALEVLSEFRCNE